MSTPAKPRKPAKLGAAGATLWGRLVGLYVFDAREVTILEQACRQADLVAVLDREIARAGIVVEGYNGQPRLSAMVAEVRRSAARTGGVCSASWPCQAKRMRGR